MNACSDSQAWLEVLGQLHPLVLHFPVAIISVLAILELTGVIVRRPFPRAPLLVLVWVNVLFAGISVLSGLTLADLHGGDFDADDLGKHQVLGVAVGIASLLMALLASVFRARAFYRWGLVLAFGLLIPGGHIGYTLTHGDKITPAVQRVLYGPPPAPKDATSGSNGKSAPPPADGRVSYVQHVAPVLGQYCAGCHGEKKHKGELRLDTQAGILAGSENGAVLVPGKPAESVLVTNIRLPLEAEEHMPPKAKAQPKPEQVELLVRWIEQGAQFDGVAPKVVVPDEPEEPAGKGAGKGEPGKQDADPDAAGNPDPAAVQVLRDELVHVAEVAQGSPLLRVDFAATAPKIDDAAAARLLGPLCAHIAELSLARAPVTDATLQLVGRMRSLQRLDLRGTRVTMAGLTHLRPLKGLKELVLAQTPLLDPAVESLLALPALERLYVWDAGLGEGPLARLRARPGLTVDAGGGAGAQVLEVEPEVKLAKGASSPAKAAPPAPVNTVCPVSGKAVDAGVSIVHEGRTVAFCCGNCLAKFQAEPGRYPVAAK